MRTLWFEVPNKQLCKQIVSFSSKLQERFHIGEDVDKLRRRKTI